MATTSQLGRPVGATGKVTRQGISEATMRCVARTGNSRATIREIARTAQMTRGSLYFPNKSDPITAAFVDMAEVVLPRLTGQQIAATA